MEPVRGMPSPPRRRPRALEEVPGGGDQTSSPGTPASAVHLHALSMSGSPCCRIVHGRSTVVTWSSVTPTAVASWRGTRQPGNVLSYAPQVPDAGAAVSGAIAIVPSGQVVFDHVTC
jgi:hypothetical protein